MITLGEIAKITGGRIVGDQETAITGIKSIADAGEGDITFLSSSAYLEPLRESRASAVIVSETTPLESLEGKNALFVKNPLLAYAQTAYAFLRPANIEKGINPLAAVGPGDGPEGLVEPHRAQCPLLLHEGFEGLAVG